MHRELLTVEKRKYRKGEGLLLEPGFVPRDDDYLCPGMSIMVRRPSGTRFNTMIGNFELAGDHFTIILPPQIKWQSVPVGSVVWARGW